MRQLVFPTVFTISVNYSCVSQSWACIVLLKLNAFSETETGILILSILSTQSGEWNYEVMTQRNEQTKL